MIDYQGDDRFEEAESSEGSISELNDDDQDIDFIPPTPKKETEKRARTSSVKNSNPVKEKQRKVDSEEEGEGLSRAETEKCEVSSKLEKKGTNVSETKKKIRKEIHEQRNGDISDSESDLEIRDSLMKYIKFDNSYIP